MFLNPASSSLLITAHCDLLFLFPPSFRYTPLFFMPSIQFFICFVIFPAFLLSPFFNGFIRLSDKITPGTYLLFVSPIPFSCICDYVFLRSYFQISNHVLTQASQHSSGISRIHKPFHFLHREGVPFITEMTVQFHIFPLVNQFLHFLFPKA